MNVFRWQVRKSGNVIGLYETKFLGRKRRAGNLQFENQPLHRTKRTVLGEIEDAVISHLIRSLFVVDIVVVIDQQRWSVRLCISLKPVGCGLPQVLIALPSRSLSAAKAIVMDHDARSGGCHLDAVDHQNPLAVDVDFVPRDCRDSLNAPSRCVMNGDDITWLRVHGGIGVRVDHDLVGRQRFGLADVDRGTAVPAAARSTWLEFALPIGSPKNLAVVALESCGGPQTLGAIDTPLTGIFTWRFAVVRSHPVQRKPMIKAKNGAAVTCHLTCLRNSLLVIIGGFAFKI